LLLLSLKHVLGLASNLTQVLLITHQQVEVHNLLVKEHARDLANEIIAVSLLDAWVNHVTNTLLLLLDVGDGGQCLHLLGGGEGNLDEVLGGGGLTEVLYAGLLVLVL